nr:XrtA/PEP-CTERM system-associated ATPase [uncultured Desulfobulbus sp.]
MYEKFYGLKEKPFKLIPNPQFLYLSKKHQNALTYLEYGLAEGSGFILLTGEIGSGKTTTIRHILNRLEGDLEVGVISNTNVDSDELINLVAHEFGIEGNFANKAKALDAVFHHFIARYAKGKRVLLVIDEAQNLSIQALEEVRMLSNLQTDEQALLQIMLIGQPELRRKLQLPELTQLSQRVAVYYHLGALEREELEEYLAYRLEKVGGKLEIFAPSTFDRIYEASGGIPRIINLICDTALVYGYAESIPQINDDIISQVIRDKEGFGLVPSEKSAVVGENRELFVDQQRKIFDLEQRLEDLRRQFEQLMLVVAGGNNRVNERLIIELMAAVQQGDSIKEKAAPHVSPVEEKKSSSRLFSGWKSKEKKQATVPADIRGGQSAGENAVEGQKGIRTIVGDVELSMIDLHCHILPDIDDGAKNFEEAVEMARLAAADGIAAIVATPHLKDTLYKPAEISRRVSWLNHLLRQEGIALTIMPGAEVSTLFTPEQARGFTINDTEYVLIEFPLTHLPNNAGDVLAQFIEAGYKPVIAHPERNPTVIGRPEVLKKVLRNDCYVQVTAGSVIGEFGKDVQQCSHQLLRSGLVDVIASDAHSSLYRKPLLADGVKCAAEIIGAEAAQRMVFATPAKIISGLAL